jgi:hypothetical protein
MSSIPFSFSLKKRRSGCTGRLHVVWVFMMALRLLVDLVLRPLYRALSLGSGVEK